MNPNVCVLIAAWNQADKTMACLETVFAQDYPAYSVLLIDNGSSDDTVSRVSNRFPEVEIISTGRNLGFAGGYNRGLRRALEEDVAFIFLLNNDTLLAPDCLSALVEEAKLAGDVGIVTSKIYYAQERNRIWSVGGRIHPWTLEIIDKGDGDLDVGQWSEARELDYAPFCGVLMRRELAANVGLLDEEFFLYYEDMDFCRRARQAGYRLRLAPQAKIWHAVSASSGGRGHALERYWIAQSSGRYFRKHGRGWRLLIIIPYRFASAIKTTIRLLLRRRPRPLLAYWLGLVRGWVTGRATTPPPRWVLSG